MANRAARARKPRTDSKSSAKQQADIRPADTHPTEIQPSGVPTPGPHSSRWQLTVSSMLLLCWILFLAWIAMYG